MVAPPAGERPIAIVLARAFAPMHKRALGLAVGITAASAVWLLTAAQLLADPVDASPLELLAQIFYGFAVTWRGALIGASWAFVLGFVAGWFAAFLRNLFMATWLAWVRIRADLSRTTDFLDQI